MVHVGIGYDVHQLVGGRKLILGGVEIPHTKGLDGHSDADALMHAICDAILGALGEEDIGHFFPNTDPRWKGAPSKVFLEEAARQVLQRNGRIVNVDATVIAQAPKIYPHLAGMKRNIADALGVREAHNFRNVHDAWSVDNLRQTGCVCLFPIFETGRSLFVRLLGELGVYHRRTNVRVTHVMLHVDDRFLEHRQHDRAARVLERVKVRLLFRNAGELAVVLRQVVEHLTADAAVVA